MIYSLVLTAVILLVSQTLFFQLASRRKNNGIADIGWGAGFPLIALGQMILHWPPTCIQSITVLFVLIWGGRLIRHLLPRIRSGREDWRYAEMRKHWGRSAAWKSYTHVFLFQGFLLGIAALSIVLIFQDPAESPDFLDYAGIALFLFGFVFELIADRQLDRFIRSEKSESNRIMTRGLWRVSRHPNYFGEAVLWWGIGLIGLSAPSGWLALISPVLITFLLIKVSGVPFLERRFKEDPQFQAYKKMTPIFFPWFPKETKTD